MGSFDNVLKEKDMHRSRISNLFPASVATLIMILPVNAAFSQTAASNETAVMPEQIKWMTQAASPGMRYSFLTGRGDQPGFYEQRVEMNAGAMVPPHVHPDARCVTVLSGSLSVGKGEVAIPSEMKSFPAGSFYCIPAGAAHYVSAQNGNVVYQEGGVGPTGITFFKKEP